jgi:hypothetical protein
LFVDEKMTQLKCSVEIKNLFDFSFFFVSFFIQSYQNVFRQVLNPFQIKIIPRPRLVHRAVRRRRQRTGVEF